MDKVQLENKTMILVEDGMEVEVIDMELYVANSSKYKLNSSFYLMSASTLSGNESFPSVNNNYCSISILYEFNCLDSFVSELECGLQLWQLDLSGNEIESITIIPSFQIVNLSKNRIRKMLVMTDNVKIISVD